MSLSVSTLGSNGSFTVKVEPRPISLSTVIFPPCPSTNRLQMGKPKPMPFAFVVNNGVQSFDIVFLSMPIPVSEKVKTTLWLDFTPFTVSVPPFGIASIAFLTRLVKTLNNFLTSDLNLGASRVSSTIFTFLGTFRLERTSLMTAFGQVSVNSSLTSLEYSSKSLMILFELSMSLSMIFSISLPR